LDSIGISWDLFHAEYIDPKTVRNAITACRKLGIYVQITCVVTSKKTLATSVNALGVDGFEIPIVQVACLPVGRARTAVPKSELLPPSEWERDRACRNDFDTLALIHDGSVYPCCAVGGFTEGIRLGVFPEESMQALLERRDNGFRWRLLASRGPKHILDFATEDEKRSLGIEEDQHDCVKCNRLFSSPLGSQLVVRAEADVKKQARVLMSALYVPNDSV
jgi:hypothetical protein